MCQSHGLSDSCVLQVLYGRGVLWDVRQRRPCVLVAVRQFKDNVCVTRVHCPCVSAPVVPAGHHAAAGAAAARPHDRTLYI